MRIRPILALCLSLLLLMSALPPVGRAAPATAGPPAGINLATVVDYATEFPFVDVMKSAREWNNWNPGGLDLDEHGWVKSLKPGQTAFVLLFVDLLGNYPAGDYVVLYDGEGRLQFDFFNNPSDGVVVSQQPGRIVLRVTPTNRGLGLRITETNPANYIRNIRVIMPGFEETYQTQPFHPDFLRRWEKLQVFRFMDWMRTNDSPVVTWAERTTPQHYTQARAAGVALEHMIQLANTAKVDPWFTIPAKADDDYVRRFATMVRDQLDPDRKVYVEWSNETWNSIFSQHRYAVEQGRARGFSGSDWDVAWKYHAHRAGQIFTIFAEVFDSTDRLVRVLGGFHHGGDYAVDLQLRHEQVYTKADALAIAPYFAHAYGGAKAEQVKRWTLDQVFADLPAELEISRQATERVARALRPYGLQLIAYEGGQHMSGTYHDGRWYPDDDALTAKLIQINRDPRMADIYRQDLANWLAAGGGLYVAFSSVGKYTKWGSWGLLEHSYQDPATAPKYRAFMDWAGQPVPPMPVKTPAPPPLPTAPEKSKTDVVEKPKTETVEKPKTEPKEKPVPAPQGISVKLNGQRLATPVPPLIRNNRVLVPARPIFEAIGASVEYEKATHSVIATRKGRSLRLKLETTDAWVDGTWVKLDEPATIVDGWTYVPLRFVGEAFRFKVWWDGVNQIAWLDTNLAPTATDMTKVEPVKTDPAKTQPVKTEPVKTEPVKTEPVKTDPTINGLFAINKAYYMAGGAIYVNTVKLSVEKGQGTLWMQVKNKEQVRHTGTVNVRITYADDGALVADLLVFSGLLDPHIWHTLQIPIGAVSTTRPLHFTVTTSAGVKTEVQSFTHRP